MDMARQRGLKLKESIWHFRTAVPNDLLERYASKKEIAFSFDTKDYHAAEIASGDRVGCEV
jgi:hypothetical protein